MTIRKNFLLNEETAEHLKQIAINKSTTQTNIIKILIEEKYKEISKQEKLEAFRSIKGMSPGSLIGKSIQSIKTEMALKI